MRASDIGFRQLENTIKVLGYNFKALAFAEKLVTKK
jgi:hypothetical protein